VSASAPGIAAKIEATTAVGPPTRVVPVSTAAEADVVVTVVPLTATDSSEMSQ
jgi:hypothetical protein